MTGSLKLEVFGAESASAIVLLHPIATRAEVWCLQVPILARRFRVIVPDLPGHGGSAPLPPGAALHDYAAAVLGALEPLGLNEFSVAGLSFGGMVAQAMALAAPSRIRRLVLAHCGAVTPAPVTALWQQRVADAQAGGMAQQVRPTLDRWFTPDFLDRAPAASDWIGRMVADTALAGYIAAVHAICGLDHVASLVRLQMPTLVIAGQKDMAVSPAVSQALAAGIPGAEFRLMADAAHMSHVEQAATFTETLDAFLQP
ncbi:alpha/beta fold hydrolase [Pseudacidovorax intermedius]|uniref:3-oxoadipate enol-lactonase n=1 Tax=Pseudacidovorax intermedius TaxID=433924 RepID=A0A370FN81_9BURK|nr:alpha/beta fold hydrolase [Pseudacidovorax intermedius]RDI28291.1 3-oxoadipate enol-lactonase [Pseudacidovorax intermedius]